RTFERKAETPLIIVKKDGTRQESVRDRLIRGLLRACAKRPVTTAEIEHAATAVEQEVRNSEQADIDSLQTGAMVLDRLAEIDEVVYVRFASVYRQFENIKYFLDELKEILQTKRHEKNEKQSD